MAAARQTTKGGDVDLPVYLRIRRDLRHRIEDGSYPIGTQLPSENELAETYGVTRLTVRHAIDGLVADDCVVRLQGKGVFVTAGVAKGISPQGFRGENALLGRNASVRVLRSAVRSAGPYYARLFDIDADDDLFNIRRLNSVDGRPESLEEICIPVPLFPGIPQLDVTVFSLYDAYANMGHPVAKAIEYLDVTELTARDAQLLRLQAGDLALAIDCKSYDAEGRVIERSVMISDGVKGAYSIYS